MNLERVTKRYGGRAAVDAVSLEVRDREVLALLGPSGSGKSTLLLMIAGLIKLDEGSIRADGKVGMVFQDLALWPHMTVERHLRFVAPSEDPGPILQSVELSSKAQAKPSELSGGEAQRLALARTLAGKPRNLLLDEPFGALDRRLREKLLDLVLALHRKLGMTTVVVTHDYEDAFRIADRVAVLIDGRLAQIGTPAQVYSSPATAEVAELTGPVSLIDGKPVRPEKILLAVDSSGDEVVRCSPRAGRWLVEVARNSHRVLAESETPLAVGSRVRVGLRGNS